MVFICASVAMSCRCTPDPRYSGRWISSPALWRATSQWRSLWVVMPTCAAQLAMVIPLLRWRFTCSSICCASRVLCVIYFFTIKDSCAIDGQKNGLVGCIRLTLGAQKSPLLQIKLMIEKIYAQAFSWKQGSWWLIKLDVGSVRKRRLVQILLSSTSGIDQ